MEEEGLVKDTKRILNQLESVIVQRDQRVKSKNNLLIIHFITTKLYLTNKIDQLLRYIA